MNIKDWYSSPTLMVELAKAIHEEPLKSLLAVLQSRAKAQIINSNDVTQIALAHAALSGYQKALDDITALSQAPKQKPTPLEEWTHKKQQ